MPYQEMSIDEKRHMAHLYLNTHMIVLTCTTPYGQDYKKRIRNPIEGDFVVEMSTLHRLVHRPFPGDEELWDGQFTKFIKVDKECIMQEDDEYGSFYSWYEETYYVCEHPNGEEYRWHNCDLWVAPIDKRLVKL